MHVARDRLAWWITLNRPGRRNALSADLLAALEAALEQATGSGPAVVVLRGDADNFCSGMEFADLARLGADETSRPLHEAFARVLRRLSGTSLVSVALVEGAAHGGGVGLAAACDHLVAVREARFALPEALWGLVPAVAGLYVSRRTGAFRAGRLALGTEPVTAAAAQAAGLVDEVAADTAAAEGAVRRLALRVARLDPVVIGQVKAFFHGGAPVDPAEEARALDLITALADRPRTRADLRRWLETGAFPWERSRNNTDTMP